MSRAEEESQSNALIPESVFISINLLQAQMKTTDQSSKQWMKWRHGTDVQSGA
tara:strand:- start:328 stop:486 length:159 start_codon:yes stop_codon:yes gene_type:complete